MKTILFILSLTITSCKGMSEKQAVEHHLTKESSDLTDTLPPISNNIMVIFQDSKDNYWLGSWKDGVYKFDGKSIQHFTIENGLPSNRIEEIKEDKLGYVYINTSEGLCRYDGILMQLISETLPREEKWKLQPDDLWFKCPDRGYVARYDGASLHYLKIPKCQHGEDYLKKNPYSTDAYGLYCNYKDSKGNIWFGTALLGAFRYNGESFDWIAEEDVTEMHGGPANGVRSIMEDDEGFFWFNTEYKYKVYEPSGSDISKREDKFYERIKSIGSLNGVRMDGFIENLSIVEYLSITKDNHGHLWIATYRDGVWKYDGTKVTHYAVQEKGKPVLLFYIYKDRQGMIWLGTHENGVWRFNGAHFERFR